MIININKFVYKSIYSVRLIRYANFVVFCTAFMSFIQIRSTVHIYQVFKSSFFAPHGKVPNLHSDC
jgi:hypothetical protein